MADTNNSFPTDLGRIIRGLETGTSRLLNKVGQGYRAQAIREYQGDEPGQLLNSSPSSDCDDEWFSYKPVTGFEAPTEA